MVKFSLFLNGLCFLYLFWLMKKTNGYQPNTAFAMTICITSVIGFIFATNLQLFMVEVKYSLVPLQATLILFCSFKMAS